MNPSKKVLFLVPYPLYKAPSQRFRVENFLFALDKAHIKYNIVPFMSSDTWDIIYKKGNLFSKALGITKSYLARLKTVLFVVPQYDYIFVHREAAPLGPPIFEWMICKLFRKKMIFDFDDAIWIPNTSENNKIASTLKAFWKTKYLCKWSYKVTVGNDYLADFAKESGAKNVVFLPTVVDTINRYKETKIHKSDGVINIGWTGSHSTLKFIEPTIPIIRILQEKFPVNFIVIADKKPIIDLDRWQFIPWNTDTEISDLLNIDIGIMPLVNDAWSEGKCGFKLIQYMALGIPAVANDVGVNSTIIDNKENGFLVDTENEWLEYLTFLILDVQKRKEMGQLGQQKIRTKYSIHSQESKFINLFN
jgi:glycosyltransferase involved in cell wall biosynthesis